MSKRRLIISLTSLALLLVLVAVLMGVRAVTGSTSLDNVTTTGIIVEVGPSNVSSAPHTITYAFDVPGYPRNGNAGSYTREQVTTKKELARFRPGMSIDVERSRLVPGASRMKGFGQGSVLWHELRGTN